MLGKTQGIGLSAGLIVIFISSSVSSFYLYFSVLHLCFGTIATFRVDIRRKRMDTLTQTIS